MHMRTRVATCAETRHPAPPRTHAALRRPQAKAEQEAYLRHLEEEGRAQEVYGRGAQLLAAQPALCIKARRAGGDAAGERVYINVCTCPKVRVARGGGGGSQGGVCCKRGGVQRLAPPLTRAPGPLPCASPWACTRRPAPAASHAGSTAHIGRRRGRWRPAGALHAPAQLRQPQAPRGRHEQGRASGRMGLPGPPRRCGAGSRSPGHHAAAGGSGERRRAPVGGGRCRCTPARMAYQQHACVRACPLPCACAPARSRFTPPGLRCARVRSSAHLGRQWSRWLLLPARRSRPGTNCSSPPTEARQA